MIQLLWGIICNCVMAIVTYFLYFTNTAVRVNKEYMSHEEFIELLWPKILIGIFWLAGLILLVVGIKKILKNKQIVKKGENNYGEICGISPTGMRKFNKQIYKLYVATYISSTSTVEVLSDEIGVDSEKYPMNSFVEVKYYKGNIKIEKTIEKSLIPQGVLEKIEQNVEEYNKNHETVSIHGIEITVKK